jgi:hypothetical protein
VSIGQWINGVLYTPRAQNPRSRISYLRQFTIYVRYGERVYDIIALPLFSSIFYMLSYVFIDFPDTLVTSLAVTLRRSGAGHWTNFGLHCRAISRAHGSSAVDGHAGRPLGLVTILVSDDAASAFLLIEDISFKYNNIYI